MDKPLPERLQQLLRSHPALWRGGDRKGPQGGGISTGYTELDAALPEGGWPTAALMEVITPRWGIGELRLLLPAMRAATAAGHWLVWVAPPFLPYAPALAAAGIDLSRVIVIHSESRLHDALWSMEKALQTGPCALVFAWLNWLPNTVVRRLQLAAETGRTLGVLFREHEARHSPAALRLRLQPAHSGLHVQLVKARGTCHRRCIHLPLH